MILGGPNTRIQGLRDMQLCRGADSKKLEYEASDDTAILSAKYQQDKRSLHERAAQFREELGIDLVWDQDPRSLEYNSGDIGGSPCADAHLVRLLERTDPLSLLNCIGSLPETFRRNNILRQVVVCQGLTISDIVVGGIGGSNTIWLNADYIGGAYFKMTIFHELYHVINQLDNQVDDALDAEWRSLNPAGFTYLNEQGRFPAAQNSDLSLRNAPIGFACGYGTTNIREDKATILQSWMCQRAGLRKRIIDKQDGILREKVQILQKELALCDPGFSAQYMGCEELP